MTKTLDNLHQFTGSENWYRHGLNRKVLFTDGVKYVADQAGAYWLIDLIALAQLSEAAVAREAFQVWTLTVNEDETATVLCDDGNGRGVFTQAIDFTDFPRGGIKFYFCDNTILLPSEY